MIVVRVEQHGWPPGPVTEVARMHIRKISGGRSVASYGVESFRGSNAAELDRWITQSRGTVMHHARLREPVWQLVAKALISLDYRGGLPRQDPGPAQATGPQHGAASGAAAGAQPETDMRQGVSREEHAVMDRADILASPCFLMEAADHLGIAQACVAEAILAEPPTRQRHATNAAAHLLLFLEKAA